MSFLVAGDPGTGKSALARHVADSCRADGPVEGLRDVTLLHAHYCRADNDLTLDARVFAKVVGERAAAGLDGFAEHLHGDELQRYDISANVEVGHAESSSVVGVQITIGDMPARPLFLRVVQEPLEALSREGRLPAPVLVIVDGLDEALTYTAGELLPELLDAARRTLPREVRLLLTSRRDDRLRNLGEPDLDLTDHAPEDIRTYASRRLEARAELSAEGRDTLATRIERNAHGNFLYARYVLDDLLRRPEPIGDPMMLYLPPDLGEHYQGFLDRLSAEWKRNRLLLGLLAVSRGDGLSRQVLTAATEWPRSELDDALEPVLQYLSGPRPDGPFRIYHQSFREFLLGNERTPVYPDEAEERLVAGLLGMTPGATTGDADWAGAPAYARDHLAVHAASTGDLDELLMQPGFLLAAEPRALLGVLPSAGTPPAQLAAEAYRTAAHRIDGPEAGSYLELAALQVGAEALVGSVPVAGGTWHPTWGWWRRPAPSRVVAELGQVATALGAVDTDDGALAVVALPSELACWSLDTGEQLGRLALPEPLALIAPRFAVAAGTLGARPVAAIGDPHGNLRVLDLPSLEPVAARERAHDSEVSAIALVAAPQPLLATGGHDGMLALWDLATLEPVAKRPRAHTSCYAVAASADQRVVVSGGDTLTDGGSVPDSCALRAWAIPSLDPVAEADDAGSLVQALCLARVDDGMVALTNSWLRTQAWSVPGLDRLPLDKPDLMMEHGLVLGQGTLALHGYGMLHPLTMSSRPIAFELGHPVEAEPGSWSGPVQVDGRQTLVSALRRLTVWDVADLLDHDRLSYAELRLEQKGYGLESLVRAGDFVAAGTAGGEVRWWTVDGEDGGTRTLGTGTIRAVTTGEHDGRPVVIAGTPHGRVVLVDPADGSIVGELDAGREVTAITCGRIAGRSVIAAAVDLSGAPRYVVRLWNPEDGTEIDTRSPDPFAEPDGMLGVSHWSDKPLWALALLDRTQGPAILAAGRPTDVFVWDAGSFERELDVPMHLASDEVLRCVVAEDRLALGLRDGRIVVLRIDDLEVLGEVPAHTAGVGALEYATWAGAPVLLSGWHDGRLAIWSLDGEACGEVDCGAAITGLAGLDDDRVAVATRRGIVVLQS